MNKKNPSELSNEELLKNKKTLEPLTYMLAGALLILFIINIFTAIKKGFGALNVIPIALLPILILNFKNLAEIKKELKLRNVS